jgi:hypothetical protein
LLHLDKAFCLSAAEEREYAVFRDPRQALFCFNAVFCAVSTILPANPAYFFVGAEAEANYSKVDAAFATVFLRPGTACGWHMLGWY